MTVEEIEILVTVKVEEALKEFMKIVPVIRQQIKQAQEAFSKVDTKAMTKKLNQAVQYMKKKMQDFKKSTENNKVAIKVTNQDAQKQISQIQKQIDSLQEKINARKMKLNIITPKLDEITAKTTKEVTPEGLSSENPAIQNTIKNTLSSNKEYNNLLAQENKMTQEISMYNKLLEEAQIKMKQLEQETSKTATTQNKLSSFFGAFKKKIEQAKPSLSGIKEIFSQMPKITQKITNHIKGMGTGLKQGLRHVLKYAMALFSLRGIYSVLSNSASSWLSSQNAGAQQLASNIDYLKYSMGSVLSPIIQSVVNLVYQLMKAIQSVVHALTGINIFAKASANSYASMAGNAKKAKEETKQLAGIHDEINNIQNNKTDNGGNGTPSPNFDLSQLDTQMSPFAQKMYDFFKPLVDSWNTYGQGVISQFKTTISQIGELLSSVWGSFENIITNGTVYTTLELILAIIGNIAQAFANAWNYNGNGDVIVQNIATAFNNLLTAINNVIQSDGFQSWLNWCSNKFKEISEKIASIDWQPLMNALMQIGTTIGSIALNVLSGLVDIFKWLAENPIVAEIILRIAIAIGILSTAFSIISTIVSAFTIVMGIFEIKLLPLIAIILGIIAVVTAIILVIMNWDTIMKALVDTWEWIKQKATEIFTAIAEFFKGIWQGICDTVTGIWNNIQAFWNGFCEGFKIGVQFFLDTVKSIWENIWNGISNFFSNIWETIKTIVTNIIDGIKNTISNVLNTIKTIWDNIWNGLKTTISNVFNGIWNIIKGVINSILGGIEGMVNGVINGINFCTKALNHLSFDVPDWVPGIGGSKFGFNIPQMNAISIPRLAKGGVLTEATTVLAGEYSGARSNPEIVTPQSIMEETFDRVFSRHEGNDQSINLNLTVNVSNKKLGQILLEDLRDMKRRSGKGIEAIVGG